MKCHFVFGVLSLCLGCALFSPLPVSFSHFAPSLSFTLPFPHICPNLPCPFIFHPHFFLRSQHPHPVLFLNLPFQPILFCFTWINPKWLQSQCQLFKLGIVLLVKVSLYRLKMANMDVHLNWCLFVTDCRLTEPLFNILHVITLISSCEPVHQFTIAAVSVPAVILLFTVWRTALHSNRPHLFNMRDVFNTISTIL